MEGEYHPDTADTGGEDTADTGEEEIGRTSEDSAEAVIQRELDEMGDDKRIPSSLGREYQRVRQELAELRRGPEGNEEQIGEYEARLESLRKSIEAGWGE